MQRHVRTSNILHQVKEKQHLDEVNLDHRERKHIRGRQVLRERAMGVIASGYGVSYFFNFY